MGRILIAPMSEDSRTKWEWVDPKSLKPHPKNRNKHPKEQIERLAKLINYQGWRVPIIVSNLSGHIVSGHGRLEAAFKLKHDKVPVSYQDFDNEDHEYAFLQSDNAIALWAELDLSAINLDIPDLGPDFDINMLGLSNFEIEPADKYDADERQSNKFDLEGFVFEAIFPTEDEMNRAKENLEADGYIVKVKNG